MNEEAESEVSLFRITNRYPFDICEVFVVDIVKFPDCFNSN